MPTPIATSSVPKAFQFIEGRPAIWQAHEDVDKENLNPIAAPLTSSQKVLDAIASRLVDPQCSPARLPPSTPATRLPLADLIGSPEENRRVKIVDDTSPEDRISWHPLRSPRSSQPSQVHKSKKTARPRTTSPSSSSAAKADRNSDEEKENIPRALSAYSLDTPAHSLDAQLSDPAADLWKRYAKNSARDGFYSTHTNNLAFASSSPQPVSAPQLGNVSGLRRWTSCGIEWPTSNSKRRKMRHTMTTEALQGTVAEIPQSAPIRGTDEEKRSRIGSLIERIQESLTKPFTTEDVNGPSSSSPLPVRSGLAKIRDDSPTRSAIAPFHKDSPETAVDAEDLSALKLASAQSANGEFSSSSFGTEELDLTEFAISEEKSPLEGVMATEISGSPVQDQNMLQDAQAGNAGVMASGDLLVGTLKNKKRDDDFEDDDDFDEEGEFSMADFENVASLYDKVSPMVENENSVDPNTGIGEYRRPLAIPVDSTAAADEFGDDELDAESFVAAEVAATQSFTPPVQSHSETGKRAIQRYLIKSVTESNYKSHNGHILPEKVLSVEREQSKTLKSVTLRQSWYDSRCSEGSFIHIIGLFNTTGHCVIDDSQNMLILHPDHLVSALVVADSFTCIRRAVLQDRVKATSESSAPLTYGTMLHELFQEAMQANRWETHALNEIIDKLVPRHIEDLYQNKLSIPQAVEHLQSKVPEIQTWAKTFVKPQPSENAVIQDRNDKQVTMSVAKLLDVEEHVWSPMYGLKGNIDATVQVFMRDRAGDRVLTVPLEIKTGRNQTSTSHRAQTALYTLLLGDRYDVEIAYGILYYLETSLTSRIPALKHELRHMIQQRNELACYIRERLSLPPMLKDPHACSRCYAKSTCLIYHKLTENGDGETSGLKDKFDAVVKHLKPSHQMFFKKWDSLLTKEEAEMMKFRRELWTMLSTERERVGRCFANVILEPGTASEDFKSTKINRFRYTFRRREEDAGRSFGESSIAVGEPIVVSDESGHYALAKGYVAVIGKSSIGVAVDRRLLNARKKQAAFDPIKNQTFSGLMDVEDFQALNSHKQSETDSSPRLYRVDKDEFSNGLASVRNNLIQLMSNDVFRGRELRALIVDAQEPHFKSASTAYSLSGPLSQMQVNEDQKIAIDKIMAAQDYALVLGMPGTGKTTTIAHIIRALVAKGKSVLLTSYTHLAVDNILLKIRNDKIGVLRLGAVAKIHPEVREFAVLGTEPRTSIEELQDAYHKPQVVATTCLGINHQVFSERIFDYCIVDEASQITLPVCLGPIRMAKAFILVGDHYQLPPLVQNREALEGGLDVSLFRFLCEQHPSAVVALRHQYRMNAEIMSLSNALIYEGRLVCGDDFIAKRRLSVPNLEVLVSIHRQSSGSQQVDQFCISHGTPGCWLWRTIGPDSSPVVFLNTDTLLPTSRDHTRGSYITNPCEVRLSTQVVRTLVMAGVSPATVGVITPYRSQLALIKSELLFVLGSRDAELVEAHTADRYQGRDKNVIILSCVRNNDRDIVGDLLKDWRRVNVAITRAKTKLVIIGSKGTLSRGDVILKQLVDFCEAQEWLVDLPLGAVAEEEHFWAAERDTGVAPCKKSEVINLNTKTPTLDIATTASMSELETSVQEPGFKISTALAENDDSAEIRVPGLSGPLRRSSHSNVNKPFKTPSKVARISKGVMRGSSLASKMPVLADIVNDIVGEEFWDD